MFIVKGDVIVFNSRMLNVQYLHANMIMYEENLMSC